MKTKNLLILTGTLVALILLVFIFEKVSSGPFDGGKKGKEIHFFPGFVKEECSAIEMTEKGKKVKIIRKGGYWIIAPKEKGNDQAEGTPLLDDGAAKNEGAFEFAADSSSVAAALEKIIKMEKDELISTNPEKQTVLEVDTAKGTQVEVWDGQGKSLGKVIIGKNGPDWSSHFVRSVGSNNVYRVGESIKYSFFTDESRWRDKVITKFEKSLAKKITIQKQDGIVELAKSVDTSGAPLWNITAPIQAVGGESVTTIVNDLADVRCAEWEESDTLTNSDMGFDKPTLVLTTELENSEKHVLYVGGKQGDTSKYYVKAEGKNMVYLVYDSKFTTILKPVEELVKKEE